MSDNLDFSGKVVVVTGGARGMGLSIARRFVSAGAHVWIADINREGGERAKADLATAGGRVEFVATDLASISEVRAMIEAAAKSTGRLDVLVHNARAGKRLGLQEETEENWELATSVGVKAAFFAAQAAVQVMARKGGGSIVNIASVAGVLATNESASYHVAKAGLLQLTRYLAVAAGPLGVRVNAVLPGLIVQNDHRERFESPANAWYRDIAALYQPLGEVGAESDVAEAVAFLCSRSAAYISGASLVVDGGATVQEQFGMLIRHAAEARSQ